MVSVTRVLAPYADFSSVPHDVLVRAADRGRRVHAACAALALGLFVSGPDEDCVPYYRSFCQWFDSAVEEVIAVEQEFIHPLGFVGHPDLVVRIKGDKFPSVVDNKTPRAVSRLWAAQLAAYVKAVNEAGIPAKRAISLRLKPDGGFPIVDEYHPDAGDWAGFLNALGAWRFFIGGNK